VNQSLGKVLRRAVPPVLVSLAKALLHRKQKFANQQAIAILKITYEQRNAKAPEDEIVFRDGLSLKIHPESKEPIEYFCYRSPTMVREMDCFMEQTKDKKRLLDIGALHGVFSLVFATGVPFRRVVAVDASPIAFSRLLYNIHKNNLTNVTPIECALSDVSGTLRMHYEWEHAVAAGTGEIDQKYLSVTKRTGDELCELLAFCPDVVKIDVEGHEVKVVKGMSRLLERTRPLVFLELHPGRIIQERDQIEDLTKIFGAGGYRAVLVDGTAIRLRDISYFTEDQRMFLTPV
jgi:FkbM family methyltransferase